VHGSVKGKLKYINSSLVRSRAKEYIKRTFPVGIVRLILVYSLCRWSRRIRLSNGTDIEPATEQSLPHPLPCQLVHRTSPPLCSRRRRRRTDGHLFLSDSAVGGETEVQRQPIRDNKNQIEPTVVLAVRGMQSSRTALWRRFTCSLSIVPHCRPALCLL